MPFVQQTPRLFTKQGIEALNMNQIGVYGIFKANSWIYVGKGDIRKRLLEHLNGDNPCITRNFPTHYVTEVTSDSDNREKQLIVELKPACNKKVG
jgi:hypothetical protein